MYKKVIQNGWLIQNAQPEYAPSLEAFQRKIFPTLSEEELIKEAQYRRQIEVFPEGQLMILDGDKIIAQCSTMRYHYSEAHHTFLEISDNLWIGTHEPNGEWLYGLDLGVDPDYRKKGLARALYRSKQELVRQLGMKGQSIVGMMNGYFEYRKKYTTDEYYDQILQGNIIDPTINAQMSIGFKPIRLLNEYLVDEQCGNAGVLMIMEAEKEI